MIDVGAVAEVLLADARAGHWLARLAAVLECDTEALRRMLPFLIALHDLGKACPSFQAKAEALAARLRAAGAPWRFPVQPRHRHDLELGRCLYKLLPDLEVFAVDAPRRQASRFWHAVSLGVTAHHGSFFSISDLVCPITGQPIPPEVRVQHSDPMDWPGDAQWVEARLWLLDQLRAIFCPGDAVPCRAGNLSAVVMLLNGFTILCDWLGSDTEHFPPAGCPDFAAYASTARGIAESAVRDRRLLDYLALATEPTFAGLFPTRPDPRPVQQALDCDRAPSLPKQSLVIIEAPMGEGKTEAALLLASRLAWQHGYQGFYFALPTVATSNQMYDRVKAFLGAAEGTTGAPFLAVVNGQAEFNPDVERELRSHSPEDVSYDEEQTLPYDTWFLPRKRSLLAPYGVGTVDQAMLAAMSTRHVGLRLLGLAGKVVIVDEVHAYDLFMSRILDRLMVWLRELGASVILLSATLPAARRRGLLQSFSAAEEGLASAEEEPYPLISVAERGKPSYPLHCEGSHQTMTVRLERRADGEAYRTATAEWLQSQVAEGGRAVWICNTVGEAQAVYRELRRLRADLPRCERPRLYLFHARFPLRQRQKLERLVLGRFGPPKEGKAPGAPERPAILVATQVVEQSLDLDFDLMVSQLAPVDLLLQRLGRLHRHGMRHRPPAHTSARLVLLTPEIGPSGPRFGPYRLIYSPFILLQTLLALTGEDQLTLPRAIRSLIERVYPTEPALPEPELAAAAGLEPTWFAEALKKHLEEEGQLREEANRRVLKEPAPEGRVNAVQNELVDDEAGERHLAMQTRLGLPTIKAVLLPEDHSLTAVLRGRPTLTPETARRVLLRTVSLSHPPLVEWALAQLAAGDRELRPPALTATNALRDCVLLPLRERRFPWEHDGRRHTLTLDRRLGVLFDTNEEGTNELSLG
jgi:CRISPR-associated endonuclease/helicase Cas3